MLKGNTFILLFVALLSAVLTASILQQAVANAPTPPASECRTKRLVIVNDAGVEVMSAGSNVDGNGELTIYDSTGSARVSIALPKGKDVAMTPAMPTLTLLGGKGSEVRLGYNLGGPAELTMIDDKRPELGLGRISLQPGAGYSYISVYGESTQGTRKLGHQVLLAGHSTIHKTQGLSIHNTTTNKITWSSDPTQVEP